MEVDDSILKIGTASARVRIKTKDLIIASRHVYMIQ